MAKLKPSDVNIVDFFRNSNGIVQLGDKPIYRVTGGRGTLVVKFESTRTGVSAVSDDFGMDLMKAAQGGSAAGRRITGPMSGCLLATFNYNGL
jgi:hypothetical protein